MTAGTAVTPGAGAKAILSRHTGVARPMPSHARRALFTGLLAISLWPRRGEAHAILEASEPADGSQIPPGTVTIKLRFNSRIDRIRSRLILTRPEKSRITPPINPEGSPELVTASVILTPGAYLLRWQVLAVDGHITRGDVAFSVKGN